MQFYLHSQWYNLDYTHTAVLQVSAQRDQESMQNRLSSAVVRAATRPSAEEVYTNPAWPVVIRKGKKALVRKM